MRLQAVLIAFCAFAQQGTLAQGELGVTGGVTYYIGDLNPTRHYPQDTKPGFGLFYRHNFNYHYAVRLQGLYGTLQAYDSNSSDSLQLLRNLHFRTRVIEASALFEVNFFKYRSRDKDTRKWTPFLFVGLGYFRINPQAELVDNWYDLQPLGTEGQGTTAQGGDPYKLDLVCIPFGFGFKFNFGRVDLQLEWGMRRTYTDYIDDVSGLYVDNDLLSFENGPLAAALADRSGLNDIPGFNNAGRARGDRQTRDWYNYTGVSIAFLLGSRFVECEDLYNNMRRR